MKHKNIVILSFIIIGTILAFYMAFYGWSDIYNQLNYPEREFICDWGLILLYTDFTILGIAGIISLFSYTKKGKVWVTMVKCIIVNIILLLLLPFTAGVIALFFGLFSGFLILIPTLICLIGLWILWELIDPYKVKANMYIKYLRCIGLCYNLSLGFMRQMKCNWLFKVLKHLSINSGQSIGIEFPDDDPDTLGDTSKLYIFTNEKHEDRSYDLTAHISVKNSELGAWSYYLLKSSEYYLPLWDHANYIERKFIASKRNLIVLIHKYSGRDTLKPYVSFNKTSESSSESIISACYWSEWGGLFRESYRLVIIDNSVVKYEQISDECLLSYNCGIMF